MRRVALAISLIASPLPAAEDSPFAAYQAELASAPPPEWVNEGLRLTYETHEGLTQADLVALTEKYSVFQIRKFARMRPEDPLTLSYTYGAVGFAGFGSEYWVEPQLLRKIAEDLSKGDACKVTRGPYARGGESRQAIRFEIGRQGTWIYEESTGLLLHLSRSAVTPFGVMPVLRLEFVRRRERDLPWKMGRPPDWLFKLTRYIYRGEQIQRVPGTPGASIPLSAYSVVKEKGENWILYEQTTKTEGPWPAPDSPAVTYTSGPTQVGGLWLPPLGIKDLRRGQLLDEDPDTRTRLTVAHVGATDYGRKVVTLAEEGPGQRLMMDYEIETGILLIATIIYPNAGQTIQTRFAGKE